MIGYRADLELLFMLQHVGLRNFRCGTCDAAFTSLGEFRAHLRITMHSHMPGKKNDLKIVELRMH